MSVLNINTSSILKNLITIKELCEARGTQLVPVTKICCSDPIIIEDFKNCGIDTIADSSLANFNNLDIDIKRLLLKIRLNEARDGDLKLVIILLLMNLYRV